MEEHPTSVYKIVNLMHVIYIFVIAAESYPQQAVAGLIILSAAPYRFSRK